MHLDMVDEVFNHDPYPALEGVRSTGPAVHDDVSGEWLVTGYDDCARILSNVERFTSEVPAGSGPGVFGGPVFETMDGPRHDEIRGVWARDFQRDRLERHRPMIAGVVDDALDAFVPRVLDGECVDAVEHLTRGIPTRVIAALLGIDDADQAQFSAWSDAMGAVAGAFFDPSERGRETLRAGLEATHALNAYIAAEVDRRRAEPGDDLISVMIGSPVAGTMSEAEITANNTQLVFAGNETTAKWMAHTLVTLARHPDRRRWLLEDRTRIPRALEEVLRYETIAQVARRTVRNGDSEVAGVPVGRPRPTSASASGCTTASGSTSRASRPASGSTACSTASPHGTSPIASTTGRTSYCGGRWRSPCAAPRRSQLHPGTRLCLRHSACAWTIRPRNRSPSASVASQPITSPATSGGSPWKWAA